MEQFFYGKYELGMWELEHDGVFRKIPPADYRELIDFAWERGRAAAEEYTKRFGTRDPGQLAKGLNITVLEMDKGYATPEYRVYSEYMSNLRRIVLYRSSIEKAAEGLKERGMDRFSRYEDIRDLFVAHEIYHHIECHELGLTSRQRKVVNFRLGPLVLRSGIRALCEIGAHSFTKGVMGMAEEENKNETL